MIVVCTSDKKYINSFYALAYSINKNFPKCKIFCRYVGKKTKLKSFKNCTYSFDNKKLSSYLEFSTEPNNFEYKYDTLPKRINNFQPNKNFYSEIGSYCTGIKYDTLYDLIKKNDNLLIYCDVDTIVRNNFSILNEKINEFKADIGLVLDIQGYKSVTELDNNFSLYKKNVSLKTGGLMVFRKTIKTIALLEYCKKNIRLLEIDDDERVFDEAAEIFKPKILKIPTTFKDEGGKNASNFSKDSYMWSGHGEIKDFSSDYDIEVKKYLKASDNIL